MVKTTNNAVLYVAPNWLVGAASSRLFIPLAWPLKDKKWGQQGDAIQITLGDSEMPIVLYRVFIKFGYDEDFEISPTDDQAAVYFEGHVFRFAGGGLLQGTSEQISAQLHKLLVDFMEEADDSSDMK